MQEEAQLQEEVKASEDKKESETVEATAPDTV